jgi:hypothetical protein
LRSASNAPPCRTQHSHNVSVIPIESNAPTPSALCADPVSKSHCLSKALNTTLKDNAAVIMGGSGDLVWPTKADTPKSGDLRWVRASEVDLPESGATVAVEDYLDKRILQQWTDENLLFDSTRPEPAPEPAFLCSDAEWIRLLRKSRSANLSTAISVDSIACSPSGMPLRAGIFCLVKKVLPDGRVVCRLIIDRRPQNYFEHLIDGLELPHGSNFIRFLFRPGEVIRLSLQDASNYYYMLRVPSCRLKYQCIGPPVS